MIAAFSNHFRVLVVEEAVFDRGTASHKINLFDRHSKYADLISVEEARRYLRSLKPIEAIARSTRPERGAGSRGCSPLGLSSG